MFPWLVQCDSPLLIKPPSNFYKRSGIDEGNVSRTSLMKKLTGNFTGANAETRSSELWLRVLIDPHSG
jgi:hypothetical protein